MADDPPSIRWARLSVRTECPRCGAHLPVNAPLQQTDCHDCGARVPLAWKLVGDLLAGFEERWPDVPRREPKGEVHDRDHLTYRTTLVAASPCCPDCRSPLDVSLAGAVAPCACGRRLLIEPVPRWLKGRVPSASHVVAASSELAAPVKPEPVAMRCPSCAGALSIDGERQRAAPCGYCGVPVQIPDTVWRSLHPARVVTEWHVAFVGATAREREAARERERIAEKQAKNEAKRKASEAKREEEARRRAEEGAARAAAEATERRSRFLRSAALLAASTPTVAVAMVACALAVGWLYFGDRAVLQWIGWGPPPVTFDVAVCAVPVAASLPALVLSSWAAAHRARTTFQHVLWRPVFVMTFAAAPLIGLALAVMVGAMMVFGESEGLVRAGNGWRTGKVRLGAGALPVVGLTIGFACAAQAAFFYFSGLTVWQVIEALGEAD